MTSPAHDVKSLSPEDKRALLDKLLREREGRLTSYPLSFAQERLWFLEQLLPGNAGFNIHNALRLPSAINVAALERSVAELCRRHEVLRTTFQVIDSKPVQMVQPPRQRVLERIDLKPVALSERDRVVAEHSAAELTRSISLDQGPVFRALLLELADDDHALLVTVHHIVSDGWSMGILFEELTVLYKAFAALRPPPLPPLPIQYGDYAVWQRQQLVGDRLEDELEYWRGRLRDASPLELPYDRPRPPVQSNQGANFVIRLSRALSRRLRNLSERSGITLFHALYAAFAVLLSRYSGQTDILVGTYVANRNRAELEKLIGFFVNTVVLRSDLSSAPTFADHLQQTRGIAVEAFAHQDLPFPLLVADLQPARDLSRNPLFQIVFQLYNDPRVDAAARSSGEWSSTPKEGSAAGFDLAVNMWQDPEGLCAQFEYATDLFDHSTTQRLAGHYRHLLEQIADDPTRAVTDYQLVTAQERTQLIEAGYGRTHALPAVDDLWRRLHAYAAEQPDAPAFLVGNRELKYADLETRVGQLTGRLRASGVRPGDLVGVCLERSFELAVTLLAVWRAGGVYLPLDPSYPSQRLVYMVSDAGPGVLVTTSLLRDRLELAADSVVLLDREPEQPSADREPAPRQAGDLAYVIYTSGSTGQPKGIAVAYGQIISRLQWMWREYPFADGEVACQKTPLSFVDSLWELLGPLLAGVPTVFISDPELRDPFALIEVLARSKVSRIWLVPSQLRSLIDFFPDLGERLPALRFWVASGEPLPRDLGEDFRRTLPRATLYNLYGTSEIWDATWYEPRPDAITGPTVPIGLPIDNTQVFVLDERQQLCPIGVPGELYVAGIGLARGYLGRPELDAERFVELTIPTLKPLRAYRSGDIVRLLASGDLEFVGRRDQQVKVRGSRVEIEEVEACLRRHPAVGDAAVVASPDANGSTRLVAHVQTADGSAVPADEIGAQLRQELPPFMVPSAFVAADVLRYTPSGKLDRRALRDLTIEPIDEIPFVAPESDVERALAETWRELLGLERVGTRQDFFRIGGHSLLASQAISAIRSRWGVELPLKSFFDHPTIASLAHEIESRTDTPKREDAPVIRRVTRDQYRLRPSQAPKP